jgi:hypothetical protein
MWTPKILNFWQLYYSIKENIARKVGISVANITLILAKVGTKATEVLFSYLFLDLRDNLAKGS